MAKQKLEAELGLNKEQFDKGIGEAENAMDSFGKKFTTIAGGMGVVAAGFAVMVSWAKKTEFGADAMNISLGVSKQLFTDLMMQQQLHFGAAIKLAERENDLRAGARNDLVHEAMLRREIRKYRLEAIDNEKTLAQKIESQKKALEKTNELEEYHKRSLLDQYNLVEDQLKINQGNTKLLDLRATLVAEIANTDNSESLRDNQKLNSLIAEQAKNAYDLVQAFTEVPKKIETAEHRAKRLLSELKKAKKENELDYSYQGNIGLSNIYNAPPKGVGGVNNLPGLQPYGGTLENTTKAL
jgi:hypothetical protein